MHHLFSFKLLAAALTFIAAILGGIWPLWLRQRQYNAKLEHRIHHAVEFPAAEAVAAGVFLAAGLLHMLSESTQDFTNAGYHYPLSYLITAITFLLLLGFEHVAGYYKEKGAYLLVGVAILTAIMLIIHSLLEGLAVGISNTFSLALIIFLAIIAHKSAASFALSAELNRSTLSMISIIIWFSIFACMTPLGILVGSYVVTEHHSLLTPIFTALAAGTFLYMGTLHGLERASLIHRCCNLKEFALMVVGFSIIAIVALWT